MIIKGSQRGGGSDLAVHLMNSFDNEKIELAELYGTVSSDLMGAFAEFKAHSNATQCTDYLYSLSINPAEPLSREQYFASIQEIEARLKLTDQPRAVVFHVKDGREHCHVVWSRIDLEKMRSIQMSFDHSKLMDIACELAEKYGLSLPPGLKAWKQEKKEERLRLKEEKLEATLADNAAREKSGITPEQRSSELTALYESSDSGAAFRAALEDSGYVLAQGDRRGFVIVDRDGDVHSLSRYIKGASAKKIAKAMEPLTPEGLPDVDQAKELVREKAKRAKKDSETDQVYSQIKRDSEAKLSAKQALRKSSLAAKEQELFTRQASERLALDGAQERERGSASFRLRSAVADLIGKVPVFRSVIAPLQQLIHLDPRERHALEKDALLARHEREKCDIERERKYLEKIERRERQSLERKLAKDRQVARRSDIDLQSEFAKAAQDEGGRKKKTHIESGQLTGRFNESARAPQVSSAKGDSESSSWKARTETKKRKRKRSSKRSKGYAYRPKKDEEPGPNE